MPIKTTISIISKNDQLKKVTDNITYVNPNINNDVALQLAQKVNALTNNTYESTERTDVTELDSYTPKPRPNITDIRYRTADGAWPSVPNVAGQQSVSLNIPISQVYLKNGFSVFRFSVYSTLSPIFINELEAPLNWSVVERTLSQAPNIISSSWQIEIDCDQVITEPTSLAFTIHFDESLNYSEYNLRFTLNIVAD